MQSNALDTEEYSDITILINNTYYNTLQYSFTRWVMSITIANHNGS